MSSPTATAIFVGCASLLHLPPKFSVTVKFTITGTEFENCTNGLRNPRSGLFTLTSVYQVPASRYLPCQFDLKYVLIKCTSIQIDQSQS